MENLPELKVAVFTPNKKDVDDAKIILIGLTKILENVRSLKKPLNNKNMSNRDRDFIIFVTKIWMDSLTKSTGIEWDKIIQVQKNKI